jgi:hypothetical protein
MTVGGRTSTKKAKIAVREGIDEQCILDL